METINCLAFCVNVAYDNVYTIQWIGDSFNVLIGLNTSFYMIYRLVPIQDYGLCQTYEWKVEDLRQYSTKLSWEHIRTRKP